MNFDNLSSYQNPQGKLRDRLVPRTDFRLGMLNPEWLQNRTVLDIGCNNGYFTRYAMKCGARRAVGVDIGSCILGARELAKEEGVNAEFWQLDVESKEFMRYCPRFEVVILFSALAKVKNKDAFLDFLSDRTMYMLLFESNHGEVHKQDIELVKKHFFFSELEYLGPSEIPEKPHYMWKGVRSAEYVRYREIQNIPIEFVPLNKITGWDENSMMNQKGAYSVSSEDFKFLVEDIKNRGIKEPLIVQEHADKSITGFQGSHRYMAAKVLQYKEVPCRVLRGLRYKHLGQ